MKSLNLREFDTSRLTSTQHMFQKCSSLTSLDVSMFKTDNVLKMNFMFNSCSALTELNLLSFNTLNCKDFTSMWTLVKELKVTLRNSTAYNLSAKLPSDFKVDLV